MGRGRSVAHLHKKHMPYKDPERKGQWELAHRQRRTERRKLQRAQQFRKTENASFEAHRVPDLASHKESKHTGWFAGIVFGLPILFARSGSGH